jgi:hypothetical protein
MVTQLMTGLGMSLVFGGMTFFSAVMAPLVFTKLPPETAGRFIREVFPWYYQTMGLATLIALAGLITQDGLAATWPLTVTFLVFLAFVFDRYGLMPAINRARDAEVAGEAAAARRFERLHRASVLTQLRGFGVSATLTY